MKVIIDIEVDYEGYFGHSSMKTIKEQSLRKDYPDLNQLWLAWCELCYELRILKETNERNGEQCEPSKIITTLNEISQLTGKARLAEKEYNLLLKLLWDNSDGITL